MDERMTMNLSRKTAMTLLAGKVALGATLALGFGMPAAHADPIEEDSPGWSCVDDGNHVCGPNNPEGKPAACYDDGGVIVALWPCHVVNLGDGNTDVVADPGSPDYDEGATYDGISDGLHAANGD